MPSLRFKVANPKQLEATIALTARNYANAAFSAVEKQLAKTGERIVRRVESSHEYRELLTSPTLRGKLGLATRANKLGGDTDAEDLIKELQNFTISRNRSPSARRFTLKMPTVLDLENRLTHRLTKFENGRFLLGPIQSWFRWWEFGDQGEIDTLTVFKRTVSAVASRRGTSRITLNQLIENRSRSGQAIQLIGRLGGANSGIVGRGLIGKVYEDFGRILPAQVSNVLRKFVRNNRPNSFFARVIR